MYLYCTWENEERGAEREELNDDHTNDAIWKNVEHLHGRNETSDPKMYEE